MIRTLKQLYRDRKNQKQYLIWLYRQAKPYGRSLLGLMGIRILLALIGAANSLIHKYLVDQAECSGKLLLGIGMALGASASAILIGIFLNLWLNKMTEAYAFHIRGSLFRHILRGNWQQLRKYHSEELLTRLTSDVQTVTNGIVTTASAAVSLIAQFGTAFFILWRMDRALACLIAAFGAAGCLASGAAGGSMKRLQAEYQKSEERYRVFLQESIAQLPVLKAFDCEAECMEKLAELKEERLYWVRKKNHLSLIVNTTVRLLFTAGYLSAFISGAVQIARGEITYGTMTAFLSLVAQIQSPVQMLGDTARRGISVLASAGRLMEVERIQEEKGRTAPQENFGVFAGIRGKQISFSYGQEEILKELSFEIPAGRMTAVVGGSGTGKTTLIRLLLHFLTPDQGELVLFDQEGREVPAAGACRRLMSYVPQGNTLFSGSIRYNLKLVCPEAEEEELVEALRLACAWEFVEKLPAGLDTFIGEKALGLSEGQAQRISIARAVLTRRPVLILDEATSALDEETELRVLRHLSGLSWKPTCIFITHRKAALSFCDHMIEIPVLK